jgi:hypothetical protein
MHALIVVPFQITNAALVCFNLDVFPVYGAGVVWVFIGIQYGLFIFQGTLSYFIPDVPYAVDIQKQRREFIVTKLVEKMADTDQPLPSG